VDFTCPGCTNLLRVPAEFAGKPVLCPKCGAMLVAPEAGGAAGGAASEAGGGGPPGSSTPAPYVPSSAPDLAALGGGSDVSADAGELAGGDALSAPEAGGAPDLAGLDGGGAGVKLACPSCGQSLGVPRSYAGMMLKCPACSAAFTAPGDDAPQWDAYLVPTPGAPDWAEPEYTPQPPTEEAVATAAYLNEQSDRIAAEARESEGRRAAALAGLGPGGEAPPDFARDAGEVAQSEAARDEWSRDVHRQGLERKLEGLGPQVEEVRRARGGRNEQRRTGAQRRLRGRALGMLPGGGALAGLESLADDIAEAAGLRDEGAGDKERELVAEAKRTNQLLEELLRDQVNDGASLAERNRGEGEGHGVRKRAAPGAAALARPSAAAAQATGRPLLRALGALLPRNIVRPFGVR